MAPRLLLAGLLAALVTSSCAGGRHAVHMLGGFNSDSGNFHSAVVAPAIGLEGLIGVSDDGISLEAGWYYTDREQPGDPEPLVQKTSELAFGVRKTWNVEETIQPYLGAGLNWISGEVDDPFEFDFSGTGLGTYARGGVGFQVRRFLFGAELRASITSAEAGDSDLSYLRAMLFIGLAL